MAVAVFVSLTVVFAQKNMKEQKARKEEPILEYQTEFQKAEVVSKRISGRYSGSIRTPKYVAEFFVTFLTENKATVELPVNQEFFECVKENQKGILVTKNNVFVDFGDGEDIEQN